MRFELPPNLKTAEGNTRRVGFELEFAGPELDVVADGVARLFGGEVIRQGKFKLKVNGTRYGDFSVESDSNYLKDGEYGKPMQKLGIDPQSSAVGRVLEKTLAKVTSVVLPSELVTPPIPMDQVAEVEKIRELLEGLGAKGTTATVISPFGLHINPEIPKLDGTTLLAYLRAFLLLEDWIRAVSRIDIARRVAPFIRPFSDEFVEHMLDPEYAPTTQELIDDYMTLCPTRNRPLDLLPLLAEADRDRVMAKAEDKELVKPRPAFHYRLPDCLLGEPGWTIAEEWNRWVEVEKLAAAPERIAALSQHYFDLKRSPLGFSHARWARELPEWMQRRLA